MDLEPENLAAIELCSTDMLWLVSEDHLPCLASASVLVLRAILDLVVVCSHWKLVPIVARRLDLASLLISYVAFDYSQ